MASPQKENGYTAIANELLEKFCCPGISGSEYRILLTVLRKTYGFQKKKDYIALSQFSKETGGMKRSNAVEAIKSLVAKRILVKEESTYSINKNWEEWVVVKRIHSSQKHNGVVVKSITSSSQLHTYKRNYTKETITKETSKRSLRDKTFNPLGSEIIKAFEEVDPKNKTYYGNKTQRASCDFLIQEYGLEQVLKVIQILPKTNGIQYLPTITSPSQLKEKWKTLETSLKRKKNEAQEKKNNLVI